MRTRRGLRRNVISFVIALAIAAAAAVLQVREPAAVYRGGPLHAVESVVQDAVLRTRDPDRYGTSVGRDPRQIITIVAMDERSLTELGLFRAWPRTHYAQVLDQLLSRPPRVVVFDVGFFEPSLEDAQLAEAFGRARARRPSTAVAIAAVGGGTATLGPAGLPQFSPGPVVVPALAEAAEVGATNVLPDDRGVVRSMPLMVVLGGDERPSVGLLAVARYLRRPTYLDGRPDSATALLAGRQIPVDGSGSVRINYFGPPSDPQISASTFRTVSFVDVLHGRVDPAIWQDGIVFIGLLGAAGFADDYWTPVSDQGRKMSGVEIHANVAATLLSTQFLRDAPLVVQVALILALVLLVALLTTNLSMLGASLTTPATLGGFLLATLVVLDQFGVQLALATPLLGGGLAFGGITTYRVVVEQRHARALKGALASVIPPSVAHEIDRDPDRVRMGGERRVMTVLFTDLKGFTTFSEQVDPELLSRVIAEYLDAMTAVVFQHGGTVDKFVGDAVMAFWNAPLDDAHHAQHACDAAIEMQAALSRLGDQWEGEGLPRQQMRIGINSGLASVGNMGSSRRFAYTALGDAVNLAARLEPLNNEYGSWICVSQATLDATDSRERYLARYLDLVTVKGRHEPVPVYELLGYASDAVLVTRYNPVLDLYHRGIILYQAQQFEAARQLFAEAQFVSAAGTDGPSGVYVERCRQLLETPAGDDWNPVHVMKHK